MTRYLIERLGFRAVAWESAWLGAERVAQAVATCAEAPEEAIRNLYAVGHHPQSGAGSFLARSLGKNYVSIALAALDTGMDYPRVECGTSDRIGRDASLERTLHDLGEGDLLVNLDQPGLIPALLPAGRQRLGTKRLLADQDFDLLLYLESSPPMTPLHREPCG